MWWHMLVIPLLVVSRPPEDQVGYRKLPQDPPLTLNCFVFESVGPVSQESTTAQSLNSPCLVLL